MFNCLLFFQCFDLTIYVAFFPNKSNARNLERCKDLYCKFLLGINDRFLSSCFGRIAFDSSVFWLSIQRFILIFVLVLIFEIIDVTKDDPHLQTVPQMIGVEKTKN